MVLDQVTVRMKPFDDTEICVRARCLPGEKLPAEGGTKLAFLRRQKKATRHAAQN